MLSKEETEAIDDMLEEEIEPLSYGNISWFCLYFQIRFFLAYFWLRNLIWPIQADSLTAATWELWQLLGSVADAATKEEETS